MAGGPAQVIDDLAGRWSLRVERPFQPGGAVSWVAPARTATGERVVLRAGRWHYEAAQQADGLRARDSNGAVRPLAAEVTGSTSALLLEACGPGTPLSRALPPHEQDVIIAGLPRRLWIEPSAGHPLRPLQSMCDQWAASFERDYAAARRASVSGLLDPASPGPASSCSASPAPVTRPMTPLQHMLSFPGRLAAGPAGSAHRMAALLGRDRDRVRGWFTARCVQESLSSPELRLAATPLAP